MSKNIASITAHYPHHHQCDGLLSWIAEKRNLLVAGKCGLGKTWLACALARRDCREGCRVYYARMPRLLSQLEI
jgi:DNA replication protein DnaC